MKNVFRIFLIFLYFGFCFLFKDNFETYLSKNSKISYNLAKPSVVNAEYHDNSAIAQSNSQEITNIQKNNQKNNSAKNNKLSDIAVLKTFYKNIAKHFIYRNIIAVNLENIIYTRAP